MRVARLLFVVALAVALVVAAVIARTTRGGEDPEPVEPLGADGAGQWPPIPRNPAA